MPAAMTKHNNLGAFKERYANAPTSVFGKYAILRQEFPFEKKAKLGRNYHQAVRLTRPSGFTYTSKSATEYTSLKTPKAMTIGDAYLEGASCVAEAWLTHEMMANLGSKDEAFFGYTDLAVEGLMDEIDTRREIAIIDGSVGIGFTSSATSAASTTIAIVLTARSWSAPRWLGAEGNIYQFYDGATQKGNNGEFTLSSVDFDNKTLTFTGAAADITQLLADVNATSASLSIRDEDSYGKDMVGLNAAATATSTLWGIDTSSYAGWKGQTYTLGSSTTLTKSDIFLAHAQGSDKGLTDALCLLPPIGMAHLLDDLQDLQRFTTGEFKAGSKSIEVLSPSGRLKIMQHPLCTQGEGYLIPMKGCKRVGSTEFSFGDETGADEGIFTRHPSYNVSILRAFADEAFFCETPGQLVKIQSNLASTTL